MTTTNYGVSTAWTLTEEWPDAESLKAPFIQIRWAESDLEILETHPLTPELILTTTDSIATTTMSPDATPGVESEFQAPTTSDTYQENIVADSNGTNGDGGLHTGAKAGIAVGVAVGGLIIILAVVMIWLRERKRKGKQDVHEPTAELPGSDKQHSPTELPAPGNMERW